MQLVKVMKTILITLILLNNNPEIAELNEVVARDYGESEEICEVTENSDNRYVAQYHNVACH